MMTYIVMLTNRKDKGKRPRMIDVGYLIVLGLRSINCMKEATAPIYTLADTALKRGFHFIYLL